MALGDELAQRVEDLLAHWDPAESKATAKWLADNFQFKVSKTPSGQKENKRRLELFWWGLNFPSIDHVKADWPAIKPSIPEIVAKFTTEGGAEVPAQMEVGGVTYLNPIGLSKPALAKMASIVDAVFKSLHGWRRKALAGQPKVSFSGPDAFRGTSKARYNSTSDTMFIRATPAVVKRTGPQYASFEYILVHELGHRYEFLRRVHTDFSRREWHTTPYSETEGGFGHSEAFAELFALGHFGITSWGSQEFGSVIEKYETLMTSGQAEPSEPDPARVARIHLSMVVGSSAHSATFQVPSVIRRKDEAEGLVHGFTSTEREILRHLHLHGTVLTEAGTHATLGPQQGKRNPGPRDYQKIPNGLLVLRDLERTKWVKKHPLPTGPHHAFNWWLTREAENVFRLASP